MSLDIEKELLEVDETTTEEMNENERQEMEARDLMRLRQCNFVLPEVSHLRLRQLAAELNMSLYSVARAAVFLGIYKLQLNLQNPKTRPLLLEFMEEHRSLKKDRRGEVHKGS